MSWTDLLPAGMEGSRGITGDLAELNELVATHEQWLAGEVTTTVDALRTILGMPGWDPDADAVTVRLDGSLVGAAYIRRFAPYVRSWTEAWVHPDHVGLGIGTAIVAWATDRARSCVDEAPDGTRVTTSMGADARNDRAKRLFVTQGFHENRHFLEMAIDLDESIDVTEPPDGIIFRHMAPDESVDALAAADMEAFRDHFGSSDTPFPDRVARWEQWRTSELWDDSLVWLAMDGNEIAGFNVSLRDHGARTDQGYIASLGVRRPWRGRGVARSLLTTSFAEFRNRGKLSAALHVDAESITGATRLYTGVGMVEVQREIDFEKELRSGEDIIAR